jgi:hypothetical protein
VRIAILLMLGSLVITSSACASGIGADWTGGDTVREYAEGDGGWSSGDGSAALPTVSLDASAPRLGDGGPRVAGSDGGALPDAAADAGSGGGDGGSGGTCRPSVESCNGRDDDCDGLIDEDAACPCPREVRGGRTYLFCEARRSWVGAQVACASVGYTLAKVETAAEDAQIHAGMVARSFADTWIGLNDATAEGTWRWADGSLVGYTHWDEGEPNDGGGEDCGVIMTTTGRTAEWDDRGCGSERPSVCEAP